MMQSNIKYSIFRYMPSLITTESIVVGVLIIIDDEFTFHPSTNLSRISNFDDELDIEHLKIILKTLEKEMSTDFITSPEDIMKKMQHFVNEFSFDPIVDMGCIEYQDNIVETLKKTLLKYDYEKSKRLSKKEELKLINAILKSKHIKYAQNQSAQGFYNERILYDYIFMNYGIKFFSFNTKSLKQVVNHVKAWAWNCTRVKDLNTIFIYDYDRNEYPENENEVKMLLQILNEDCDHVFDIQGGLNFVNTVTK